MTPSVTLILVVLACTTRVSADSITLQVCAAGPSQQWKLLGGGLIQSTMNTSVCIGGPSGSLLSVDTCDPTAFTQQWFFLADGTVRSPDNLTAWNVPGQSRTPGTGILAFPFGTPINGNLLFAYSGSQILGNQSGLCVTLNTPPVPPRVNALINVTEAPCFLDNTGSTDVTQALQACVQYGYSAYPPSALFFPVGVYLVSDTIHVAQANPGGDDGINVVPGRFISNVLLGSTSALPTRPIIRLAPNSAGFGNPASPKVVISIYSSAEEGVDMNNLFRGIDIDISTAGNGGAMGVSHPGAQGSTVTDVTVMGGSAFACFEGVNGAGGMHSNIKCIGAQYGLFVDNSQPVGSVVGMTLINQTVSAVKHFGQEVLSIVGAVIIQSPNATGAAVETNEQSFSIVDTQITCAAGGVSTAVTAKLSIFMQDVYLYGCTTASSQSAYVLPGPGAASNAWMHISEFAQGQDPSPYMHFDVVYMKGVRMDRTNVVQVDMLPPGSAPPPDLQSQHVWDEATFPSMENGDTADARLDCGAKGDNATDDTLALQGCINAHRTVYVPPGRYRISSTLQLQPGSRLIGVSNTLSEILASTDGFPNATAASPAPLIRTSAADGAPGNETVIAFLGLVTFQHLDSVFTLDWRSVNPASIWRTNFESRNCECLWMSAWQHLDPTDVPCKLPVNITFPKSQFHGVGRVYSFVNDDTGGILSTSATYRHVLVADLNGVASPTSRLRFYSMNLEHAQSEANAEIANSSWVDIYSIKSEGNLPILWIRDGSHNVTMLAFGGGISPFAYNYTFPPDFTPFTASIFRIDAGCPDVKMAAVQDHGYGAAPPYWPPSGGTCSWEKHYPYPGAAVSEYPYWTYPNGTMWNCWYGVQVATAYWYTIVDVSRGESPLSPFTTMPMDKPIYYLS